MSETTDRRPIDAAAEALRAGRYDEADQMAVLILGGEPGFEPAIALRGYVAAARAEPARAASLFERATATRPEPLWFAILADLYLDLHRPIEALAAAERAVKASERALRARPLAALARAYVENGDLDAAAEAYLGMLAIDRTDANGHMGLASVLLARGEYRPGWIEYEWRDRLPQASPHPMPQLGAASWNGMRLPGRLLVVCDQGYGDTIQFSRFLPLAAKRVEHLALACGADLIDLFRNVEGVETLHATWADIPPFMATIQIGSLPGTLDATLETIPSPGGYLAADPERADAWRRRLEERGVGKPKVGIFWSGRSTHANNKRRSIPLERLEPILAALGKATVVSLQKEVTAPDAEALSRRGILDPSRELETFADTAALVSTLDLVVSVDSGVAHLAGALGVPVWILVGQPADWRWLVERTDSPWYASARLFRQPTAGDWDAPIGRLVGELERFLASRG